MMDEINNALDIIQRLSNERYTLYTQAGHGALTPAQQQRLNEINGRLPGLWDNYRREMAADRRSRKPKSLYDFDAA